MKNLTVQELIEQLKKFDENKEVQIGAVGFSSKDSWDAPLDLEELTVQSKAQRILYRYCYMLCGLIKTKNYEYIFRKRNI